MKRNDIAKLIISLVANPNLKFDNYSTALVNIVDDFSLDELKNSLLECQLIPESFSHDSTEEKIYAKYTDILVSKAFSYMGMNSSVVRERADSADVDAHTEDYSLTADAKVFRLSRTAKNQKDFKVEALSKWKGKKDFAVLISPLFQYPSSTSQIYRQAIDKNVTLFSFVHLLFILSQPNPEKYDYRPIWEISKTLTGEKSASEYWNAIDNTVASLFNVSTDEIIKFKLYEREHLKTTSEEEIKFVETIIDTIKNLSKQDAIDRLIKSEKLDNKIIQIKKAAGIKIDVSDLEELIED